MSVVMHLEVCIGGSNLLFYSPVGYLMKDTNIAFWVTSDSNYDDYMIVGREEYWLLQCFTEMKSLDSLYGLSVQTDIRDVRVLSYRDKEVFKGSVRGVAGYTYLRTSKYLYVFIKYIDEAGGWLCLDPDTLDLLGVFRAGKRAGEGFTELFMRVKELNFSA